MLHSGEAKLIIGKRRWLTLDTVFNLNLYNEASTLDGARYTRVLKTITI